MKFVNNICVPQVSNACYGNNAISDQAVKIIQENGYRKIGLIGLNMIPAAFYLNLTRSLLDCEIKDATEMVDLLVSVKSEEELSFLERAVRIHEAVGYAVPALVYAGRLERELGADLYRLAVSAGAVEYVSNINLCSQPLPGAMHALHYQNKIMEAGDTLNILFEVPTITGYYADFHHYWSIGEPNAAAADAMELAGEAHEYLASLCKPGVRACDAFARMNEWKVQRGMEPERRMHGHGQGYGLVERPYIDANDPMVFKENMFIALHPPVQVGGASVNPAANYVITVDGARRVNTFPKGLITI
jgi:Xaa-Pro aminopeptidase